MFAFLSFYKTFISIFIRKKKKKKKEKMMADRENERVGERVRENDDSPPHILCGWGAVTLLPPPTWKIIRRPHTHSDRNSLYLYWARLCLSVPTPINPPPKAPHRTLPLVNSWAIGLLAAMVWRNFQSVPPQRKRILTPATQHQHPSPCRCFTGNPI